MFTVRDRRFKKYAHGVKHVVFIKSSISKAVGAFRYEKWNGEEVAISFTLWIRKANESKLGWSHSCFLGRIKDKRHSILKNQRNGNGKRRCGPTKEVNNLKDTTYAPITSMQSIKGHCKNHVNSSLHTVTLRRKEKMKVCGCTIHLCTAGAFCAAELHVKVLHLWCTCNWRMCTSTPFGSFASPLHLYTAGVSSAKKRKGWGGNLCSTPFHFFDAHAVGIASSKSRPASLAIYVLSPFC